MRVFYMGPDGVLLMQHWFSPGVILPKSRVVAFGEETFWRSWWSGVSSWASGWMDDNTSRLAQ